MEARTQYTDMIGTVAADIADARDNSIEKIAKYFNVDEDRFKVVGLSIYGTDNFSVSFICVDKKKSTNEKEHIVLLGIDDEHKNILNILFKRLSIVLYGRHDKVYPGISYDEEASISDYIIEE